MIDGSTLSPLFQRVQRSCHPLGSLLEVGMTQEKCHGQSESFSRDLHLEHRTFWSFHTWRQTALLTVLLRRKSISWNISTNSYSIVKAKWIWIVELSRNLCSMAIVMNVMKHATCYIPFGLKTSEHQPVKVWPLGPIVKPVGWVALLVFFWKIKLHEVQSYLKIWADNSLIHCLLHKPSSNLGRNQEYYTGVHSTVVHPTKAGHKTSLMYSRTPSNSYSHFQSGSKGLDSTGQ